jgi:hypothetical protein
MVDPNHWKAAGKFYVIELRLETAKRDPHHRDVAAEVSEDGWEHTTRFVVERSIGKACEKSHHADPIELHP